MATMGEVDVTVKPDTLVTYLLSMRDYLGGVLSDSGTEYYRAALEKVLRTVQMALGHCESEQSENARLKAALRELTERIRISGERAEALIGTVYRVSITEEAVAALEALAGTPQRSGVRFCPDCRVLEGGYHLEDCTMHPDRVRERQLKAEDVQPDAVREG